MKIVIKYAYEANLAKWYEMTIGQGESAYIVYDIYKNRPTNKSPFRSLINKRNNQSASTKEEALERYFARKGL